MISKQWTVFSEVLVRTGVHLLLSLSPSLSLQVQDAQATMRLYTMVKKNWEAEIKAGRAEKAEARKPRPSAVKPHPFKDK